MADNSFHLIIASVGETKYDGRAISITVPGSSGEMTVLAHHEPLVTTLKAGSISVKDSNGVQKFDIESGVFECTGERVVVLL